MLVIRNDAGCVNLSELIGQFCDAVIEHNVSVRNDDATPGVNRATNPSADFDFKDELCKRADPFACGTFLQRFGDGDKCQTPINKGKHQRPHHFSLRQGR